MGKLKKETDDRQNADVLVIGGPPDVEIGCQAAHIGDDWMGLWEDPPGRQFYDFRSFVFWPSENVFDISQARGPIEAINDDLGRLGPVPRGYRATRRKLFPDHWGEEDKNPSVFAAQAFRRRLWDVCRPRVGTLIRCAVHGAIVVVIAPEALLRSSFGQLLALGWLSPLLGAKYSPDNVVHETASIHGPRAGVGCDAILPAWAKIAALYGRLMAEIRDWPPFSLRIHACLELGAPDQPLYGLRVWGHYLLRWPRGEAMAWEPDMSFGQDFADDVKNVPVFAAPGHTNVAGDPKSLLFATGQGGIIVLPETVPLSSIITTLTGQQTESPLPRPVSERFTILCPSNPEKRGKQGNVWVLRVKKGLSDREVEVTIGHKAFPYLLAFYAATKASTSGLDPMKPMVGTWPIPAEIFPAKEDKDKIGKPAQQVNDNFSGHRDLSFRKVVKARPFSGGHRRYVFDFDFFELDWMALNATSDASVRQLLEHIR